MQSLLKAFSLFSYMKEKRKKNLRALTTRLSSLFASLFFACLEGGGRTLYIGVARV